MLSKAKLRVTTISSVQARAKTVILSKVNTPLFYLDHAAATPVDDRVMAAMQPYFSDAFFNPSAPYAPAIEVRRAYDEAKRTLAHCIGARADELVMTAGATESINLAFAATDGHVVTAAIEHHAVLAATQKRPHTLVQPDERGFISADSIKTAITDTTTLVSIALANNELGTVQPLRAIAEVVKQVRQDRLDRGDHTPIFFHSDASQGVGQLDIMVSRLGVDMLTLNAGKMYGPKQTGLLWANSAVMLSPQIVGGGQERGLRSGTENVPAVIGFAAALSLATKHRKSEVERLTKLRDALQNQLTEAFPKAIISGHPRHRLAGHLHISFSGLDAERVLFALENRHVYVATGSACAANKGTRSHVLEAIGMSPQEADGSLRLTLGHLSNDENIAEAGKMIIEELRREMERTGQS